MASQNINPESVANGKAGQDEAGGNRGSAVAKRYMPKICIKKFHFDFLSILLVFPTLNKF